MLMVAPSGRTKEEISLEAPSPSTHSRLIGSVPTEEELEKANIIAGSMPLKNFSGLNPPMALTARELYNGHMDHIAEISGQEDHRQRGDNVGTVGSNDRAEQTEDTDW